MKDFNIIKSIHEDKHIPQEPTRGWYLHDTISMVVKQPPKYSWAWFKTKIYNYFSKEKEEKC